MIALHTARPDEGGPQTEHETTYVGYARQPDEGTAHLVFPDCWGGRDRITHFSLGTPDGRVERVGDVVRPLTVERGMSISMRIDR